MTPRSSAGRRSTSTVASSCPDRHGARTRGYATSSARFESSLAHSHPGQPIPMSLVSRRTPPDRGMRGHPRTGDAGEHAWAGVCAGRAGPWDGAGERVGGVRRRATDRGGGVARRAVPPYRSERAPGRQREPMGLAGSGGRAARARHSARPGGAVLVAGALADATESRDGVGGRRRRAAARDGVADRRPPAHPDGHPAARRRACGRGTALSSERRRPRRRGGCSRSSRRIAAIRRTSSGAGC